MSTTSIDMHTWSGRVDAGDGADGRRWHQVVRSDRRRRDAPAWPCSGSPATRACDATTVAPGAVDGPRTLRRMLGNLAWHGREGDSLYDAGDVSCDGDGLEAAQADFAARAARLLQRTTA